MTASQLRRQLAKINAPADAVSMLRRINEVWLNDELAALPEGLDGSSLVAHFMQEEFLVDAALFQEFGLPSPEGDNSVFGMRVRPRPFGYLCEVSFVAGPMSGYGAEFQFHHDGALAEKEDFSIWIS